MPKLLDEKNVDMLTRHKVYSKPELESRYEILLENYHKTVHIEAETMLNMARKEIMPAVSAYEADLSKALNAKKAAAPGAACGYETKLISKLAALEDQIDEAADALEEAVAEYKKLSDVTKAAMCIKDSIIPKMDALRAPCDEAETVTAKSYWPFPTYGDLLFGVR